MAAMQEPKIVESEGDEESSKKKKKKKELIYPTVQDSLYRDKDIEFPLDESALVFDYDGRMGQARPFSQATYNERLSEFQSAPPVAPIKDLMWPCDPHGMNL